MENRQWPFGRRNTLIEENSEARVARVVCIHPDTPTKSVIMKISMLLLCKLLFSGTRDSSVDTRQIRASHRTE